MKPPLLTAAQRGARGPALKGSGVAVGGGEWVEVGGARRAEGAARRTGHYAVVAVMMMMMMVMAETETGLGVAAATAAAPKKREKRMLQEDAAP